MRSRVRRVAAGLTIVTLGWIANWGAARVAEAYALREWREVEARARTLGLPLSLKEHLGPPLPRDKDASREVAEIGRLVAPSGSARPYSPEIAATLRAIIGHAVAKGSLRPSSHNGWDGPTCPGLTSFGDAATLLRTDLRDGARKRDARRRDANVRAMDDLVRIARWARTEEGHMAAIKVSRVRERAFRDLVRIDPSEANVAFVARARSAPSVDVPFRDVIPYQTAYTADALSPDALMRERRASREENTDSPPRTWEERARVAVMHGTWGDSIWARLRASAVRAWLVEAKAEAQPLSAAERKAAFGARLSPYAFEDPILQYFEAHYRPGSRWEYIRGEDDTENAVK